MSGEITGGSTDSAVVSGASPVSGAVVVVVEVSDVTEGDKVDSLSELQLANTMQRQAIPAKRSTCVYRVFRQFDVNRYAGFVVGTKDFCALSRATARS